MEFDIYTKRKGVLGTYYALVLYLDNGKTKEIHLNEEELKNLHECLNIFAESLKEVL